MAMILVSACLAGIRCRYDGEAKTDPEIAKLVREGAALPVCAECMGGLGVPRIPAELTGDGEAVLQGEAKAVTVDGRDVTDAFLHGARAVADACQSYGIQRAILKDGSPSCGSRWIYDGTFTGVRRSGAGVLTRLLQQRGITVEGR